MSNLTTIAAEVEIKGALYAVEPIDPGFAGVAAVRVTKLVNGESYAVVRQADGLVVCDCPDFVCRHEGKGTLCKHGSAMLAGGFLPAPVSGGSPVAEVPRPVAAVVAPVTEADRKRAAYFGLTIPKIELAPAFVAELSPAKVAVVEPTVEINPRDSWLAWTDEDRWVITPDVEIAPEPTPKTTAEWSMGESVALLLTISAIEDEDEDSFYRLDDEYRRDFFAFLRQIDSPATTWSSWLALCQAGSPVSFPEPAPVEEARPTYRRHFVPTEIDETIAAVLFRDDRPGAFFVVGQPCPPIGDKSFARKPMPARSRETGVDERDIYPPGVWS